jgi:hypothetical protein
VKTVLPILRSVFLALMVATWLTAAIFVSVPNINGHPANPAFDVLRWIGICVSFALPVVSIFLVQSDKNLAIIGFATFLLVLILQPFNFFF